MRLLSVNELLQDSESLVNSEVFLHGVLAFSDGDVLIKHWPKVERSQEPYAQIWVYTGEGAFSFNQDVLGRKQGKRVVVHGVVTPSVAFFPTDPGAFWRVHIRATELTEHKLWCERHGQDSNG